MSTLRKRPRASKAPRRDRLMVSASRSAGLREFATLLNVRPTEFLGWILSDYIKTLRDPVSGLLRGWVDELIVYKTPEDEARVKARVQAWLEDAERKGGSEQ